MTLEEGPVRLRPIHRRDEKTWLAVRARNREWLSPWEATPPRQGAPVGFGGVVRRLRGQARQGQLLPFILEHNGQLVGQLTVGGITWGSLCSAHIGYWIDAAVAGRGLMPTAVAMATDHCFDVLGLHRIEINIRPENTASLRVVEKLGFRDEGVRRAFLHIADDWRDHRTFALTAEEVRPGGLLGRWRSTRSQTSHRSQH